MQIEEIVKSIWGLQIEEIAASNVGERELIIQSFYRQVI